MLAPQVSYVMVIGIALMPLSVQERLARERKLKEIAEAHAPGSPLTSVNAENTAVAEAAERRRRCDC